MRLFSSNQLRNTNITPLLHASQFFSIMMATASATKKAWLADLNDREDYPFKFIDNSLKSVWLRRRLSTWLSQLASCTRPR